MRVLNHSKTLVLYDGLQLFVASDQLGTAHVCLLVDQGQQADNYLCVPVSSGRLGQLLDGQIDLRQVFQSPETNEAFVGTPVDGDLSRMETRALRLEDIADDWLPETGFYVKSEPTPALEVVRESRLKQRAVIHCTLKPPESWQEPKITAEHLSRAVKLFQRVIGHAYRKALRDVTAPDRDMLSIPSYSELEVYAFSPGSFTLHMQSAAPADLVGYSQIAKALDLLDSVNALIQEPTQAVDVIARYGGHFAKAYKDLLRFVFETQTSVAYEWSMPERRDSTRREIPVVWARPLYNALVERVDLEREEIRLVGRLTKVDDKYGTWRLHSGADQKDYHGKCETPATLAGLVIETEIYEFLCDERIAEERATGREIPRLYLLSYRKL
jgi:hypothetical protein